ncbi:MAG TPA: hypothetical protein VF607_10785 [Verrucomicrobiae bacterium]
MQKVKFLLAMLLALALFTGSAHAAISSTPKDDPNPQSKKFCDAVSTLTGVAISPLLGVSCVGAWQWYQATPEQRPHLPWFTDPVFWGPAMFLVLICFIKDSAGATVLPGVLKKPLDAAETLEHKVSGLVATGAFVPYIASIFQSPDPGHPGAALASLGFATIDLHWLYNALMVPVAMAAFFIVFLASNAINILILLSPFSTVDTCLKLFRTAILGTVVGSSAFGAYSGHPWLGAAWAGLLILISYFIAGWSFRLSHFGLVFIWEFFTGRKNRFHPHPQANRLFLGRKVEKVPTRTYGTLRRNEQGQLVLTYRPWLILPSRTLVLPPGRYEAGCGVFYSEILLVEGESAKTILLLPPRFLGHEAEVATIYQLAGTRDVGLRAAWAWFKSLFSGKTAVT